MGRPWREEYKGAIYHVIARGNNREYIFREDIDKAFFLKLLKENIEGMNYRIYGYVLMSNHYHLIIQTMDKLLHEIMHQINNRYSKYFNNRYQRIGHVFQGRYKAILVQDERYLLGLLRYVHQNPVAAYICSCVEDYKWSSDVFYRKNIHGFVNTDVILNILDSDRKKAIKKYMEIVNKIDDEDYEKDSIIGDEAYKLMCMTRMKTIERKRLDEILIETGVGLEDFELIKTGSRKRHLTKFKVLYAKAALELRYTYKEIAKNISLTENSIKELIYRCQALDLDSY